MAKNRLYNYIFAGLLVISNLICINTVQSQNKIGNEWIAYDQSYLKIIIDKNGIYRITKADLINAGWSIANLNPKNIQVFFRGKEMAINVIGELDNEFNDNDYIEFYAIANDGAQDEEVYRPKTARTNKYLSLYSNETAYFLTFSKAPGKRIKINDFFDSNIVPDATYYTKKIKVYEEDWNHDITTSGIPSLLQSYFEPNESLVSTRYKYQDDTKKFIENIILENYLIDNNYKTTFETLLGSRVYPAKTLTIKLGEENYSLNLQNYDTGLMSAPNVKPKNNVLSLDISITKTNSTIVNNGKTIDGFSILYYLISYPTLPIYLENKNYGIIPNSAGKSLLKLSNALPNVIGYDISNIYDQQILKKEFNSSSKELSISIENTTNGGNIWLTSSPSKPKRLQKVDFKSEDNSQINYIIITDKSLINGANLYKDYRESITGGNNKVKIAETKQLYDEFCYGERNPIAIHRFADYMLKNSKVKNMLLLGKALSFPTLTKPNEKDDLVPSWGYPASDVLLTAGLNGKNQDVPAIPTGRVSAINNQQVIDYLNKVKQFEGNNTNSAWNKNFLQLGGGKDEYQISEFKSFLAKLGKISEASIIGGKYQMITKTKANDGTENIDISPQINDGVGMVTFFGHSSSSSLDLDIGFASDKNANFKNSPQYPFMFFNGCGAGNVFNTYTSLSNDWLITPNKGAIAILAHSFLSFSNSNMAYMEKLYKTWFSTSENLNLSLGALVQKVAEIQIDENPRDIYTKANVHEMTLQGDPAIKIYRYTKPDFQTEDQKLFLTSTQKNKTIASGDSVRLGIKVSNFGIYEAGSKISLNLKKTYLDGKSTDQPIIIKAVAYQDTIYANFKTDLNLKFISVKVDNDNKVDEMDESNNTGTIIFNWDALKNTEYYSTATLADNVNPNLIVKLEGKLPVSGMVVAANPTLDISLIDNNSLGTKPDKLEVSYRKVCDGCPETFQKLDLGIISGEPNEILAKINLKNLSIGEYELFVQGYDAKKNASGSSYSFNFKIVESTEISTIKVFPNPMTLYTTFEIGILSNNIGNDFTLNIFNQKGLVIKSYSGNLNSGYNNIFWDGKDSAGNIVLPGTYIYRVLINQNGEKDIKSGRLNLVN